MKSEDWLEAHREEIVESWNERLKPLVEGASAVQCERRVEACFQQVQKLVADQQVTLATQEVEERLFECPELGTHEQHRNSAWMLASGRKVIGDITGSFGSPEAQRCAKACDGAINYLQHSLRFNICQDCRVATCCMRSENLEPMPGGTSE